MGEAVLTVDGLVKRFGQVLAVDDQLKDSIPEMYDALQDAKEGAIIAYSSPETSGKAGDDSTSVEVYQVVKKLHAPLNEKMKPSEKGLPRVTQDDKGTPTIAKPSGAEPQKLRTQVLVQGDGQEVKATDTVVANYVGVRWEDGKVFDSSYEKGAPASFPLDNVIEGWKQGLKGQKVGSRVLLAVPTDKAYGTKKQLKDDSQYPAGALVFVVDVLGTVATPAPSPSASGSGAASPSASAQATASPSKGG